jgi:membrane protease YdiL (CAAX protease family)
MTRKPGFWIILALLGFGGAILSVQLFPIAFPLLSVDIQMDRQEALDEAEALVERFQWDPAGPRQAASFSQLNPAFQTYMELEGGGLDELNRLVKEGILSLYAWRVRHFAEGLLEEAEIRFTPVGIPLGFSLRLSEETSGENILTDVARELAVAGAAADWGMNPALYELLESSEEEQPGGRIDHTFVFQRSDLALGEATLRLRLRVAGSQLVEVSPFFHVPESFLRRFQDSRDANNSIYLTGTIAFLLLFLVLCGGGGMVHLLRERLIEWRAPLGWGVVVAGLMALGTINSLPLAWMEYDTALPPPVYLGTIVVITGLTFVAGAVFLALLFMVGEGLMRVGFPDQIQLWKLWSPGVANSTPVLGRTMAPYLILGLELGFVVTFYLVTARLAGWWSPASALVEPDLLATHFPWLTAVSTSLFAALSEETIFRAIPIGAAAILGRRYGRPGVWIWGAIILQAVVFGASHANYPQQPAFARVVEIFPTYVGWGVVCAYFGLVPTIIGHYIYDLVLFSLPLFAAKTDGIWFDRFMVMAAGTLPLVIVLLARWRKGAVAKAPDWALNRSWSAPSRPQTAPATEEAAAAGAPPDDQEMEKAQRPGKPLDSFPGMSKRAKAGIAALGLAGLVFGVTGNQRTTAPTFTIDRSQAEARARSALGDGGVELGGDWVPLFSIVTGSNLSHQFVWEEGSKEEYEGLMGRFLSSPQWAIRFVRFNVEPEERAESYTVNLDPLGEVLAVRHRLPEGRPGDTLTEEESRQLALEALRDRLAMDPRKLREISAVETARPNRTDWTFSFAASEEYPLARGEGRATVLIAGNEVADAGRFVHVPEDWERERRADESRRQLALLPAVALLLFLGLAAAILAIVLWARGSLQTSPVRVLSGTLVAILCVAAINDWPGTIGAFTTEESYANQLGLTLVGLGLGLASMAGAVGILGALGHTWIHDKRRSIRNAEWIGSALGMTLAGVLAHLSRWESWTPPDWPEYLGALSYSPSLSVMSRALTGILAATAGTLLLMAALERLKDRRRLWIAAPLLLVMGLAGAPNPPGTGWFVWVGGAVGVGVGIFLLWLLCRRLGWAILPGVVAAPALLELVELVKVRPYVGSGIGGIMGMVGVIIVVRYWTKALQAPSRSEVGGG